MLIVDDEDDNCRLLRRMFQGSYDVKIATSGAEAIELLEGSHFDVIITDQVMPGLSGTDLLTRSLTLAPDAVRILISGFPNLEAALSSLNDGRAYRFFTRPLDRNELSEAVADAVHGQSARRALIERTESLERQNSELAQKHAELEARIDAAVDERARGLRERLGQLERSITRDADTGLLTREALVDHLEREIARSERYGLLCALILVRVNGYHRAFVESPGDAGRILERMTWLIRLGSRRYDLGGRWGEDTFGLLLPHVGKSGAQVRVERMESAASDPDQPDVSLEPVVVAFPESGSTAADVVAAAEKHLGIG